MAILERDPSSPSGLRQEGYASIGIEGYGGHRQTFKWSRFPGTSYFIGSGDGNFSNSTPVYYAPESGPRYSDGSGYFWGWYQFDEAEWYTDLVHDENGNIIDYVEENELRAYVWQMDPDMPTLRKRQRNDGFNTSLERHGQGGRNGPSSRQRSIRRGNNAYR